eukprot:15339245-Ditylum_brightwellii.AAC.1
MDPQNVDRYIICREEIAWHVGANLKAPELEHHKDPGESTDRVMEVLFKEAVKDYIKEMKTLKRNIKKPTN